MPFKVLRHIQFWFLIGYATYLSLVPDPGKVFESFSDKFLHTLCWFVLYLSLQCAFFEQKAIFRPFLFLFSVSTLIEFLQSQTGRHFSFLDIVANSTGLLLATIITVCIYRFLGKHFSGTKEPEKI